MTGTVSRSAPFAHILTIILTVLQCSRPRSGSDFNCTSRLSERGSFAQGPASVEHAGHCADGWNVFSTLVLQCDLDTPERTSVVNFLQTQHLNTICPLLKFLGHEAANPDVHVCLRVFLDGSLLKPVQPVL